MEYTNEQIGSFVMLGVYYLIFIGILVFWKLKPPKNFPSGYGYRTPLSLKNQANWDFVNKLAPNVLLVSIHIFAIVFSALVLLKSDWFTHVHSPMLVILGNIAALVLSIWYIEVKLKKFDTENTDNKNE